MGEYGSTNSAGLKLSLEQRIKRLELFVEGLPSVLLAYGQELISSGPIQGLDGSVGYDVGRLWAQVTDKVMEEGCLPKRNK